MEKKIILASPPETVKNALLWGLPIAHMAYKTDGASLYRALLPDSLRRGFMLLTNANAAKVANLSRICGHIIKECENRSFDGVMCDFFEPCPFAKKLLAALSTELNRRRLRLFVPEWAGSCAAGCHVIASTAVSGGSLYYRLSELCAKYGAERLVLDLEILTRDFLLPDPAGEGREISRKRIEELLDRSGSKVFFSEDLCCNYFNYRSERGQHFVLFDNEESVQKKIRLGISFGISHFCLLYPETNSEIIRAAL